MDDTFVIHKEVNKQGFLQHINSVDPAIRFTVEDNKEDGSIPFFDTIVKPAVDGTLSMTVYRKPTHTDQYLQWDSHHHLSAKFSVIQTLSHRDSTVCSNPELLQKGKEHLRKALTNCKYPRWALDKVEKRLNRSSRQVNDGGNNNVQSANHGVQNRTGHTTNQNNFQIIGREGHNLARNIKESVYIRVNNPTLNNNIGKFNLSNIWDRVLLNTKDLTPK